MKGFFALRHGVQETTGIDVNSLTPSERSSFLRQHEAPLQTTVLVDSSGEALPAHRQRRGGGSQWHPRRINVRERPVELTEAWIEANALVARSVCISAAITGGVLDRTMEDCSCEHALLRHVKGRGNLFVLHVPPADTLHRREPFTALPPLPPIRLVCGRMGRTPQEDYIHVHNFVLPQQWAARALKFIAPLYASHGSDFHEKDHAGDERKAQAVTLELGWSGFPGGADNTRQGRARREGVPYKLSAWLQPCGIQFMDTFASKVLPPMWGAAAQHYPAACRRMADAGMAHLYGLCGTGWNKITIGINTPTCLHYDNNNVGVTALLIVGLNGLRGGSHVLVGVDLEAAVALTP